MEKAYYSSVELSERWCCCLSTIANIRKRGIIPSFRPEGSRQYLFPSERVHAYEASRLNGGTKKKLISPPSKKWRV